MSRSRIWLYFIALAIAHLFADMTGGMLPPVLPQLMERFDTRLFGGTALLMIFAMVVSGAQPFFGKLNDRKDVFRKFMFIAPAMGCIPLFMAFTGQIGLISLLIVGGSFVAIFHPSAVREVQFMHGLPRGTVISIFMAMGFCGYAGGSLVGAQIVESLGMRWLFLPIIPAALVGVAVFFLGRSVHKAYASAGIKPRTEGDFHEHGYPFWVVWLTATAVAFTSNTLVSLMPTYVKLGQGSVLPGGRAVMLFGLLGAVGGIFFGAISDRIPRGYSCAAALLTAAFFLSMYFMRDGASLIWFSCGGLGIGSAFPVLIAMSHEAKGLSTNLRNGMMVGASWALAALILPAVGAAGDAWGLRTIMPLFMFAPLAPAAAAMIMELFNKRQAAAVASESEVEVQPQP